MCILQMDFKIWSTWTAFLFCKYKRRFTSHGQWKKHFCRR